MSRLAAALTGLLTGLTAVMVLATPAAAHARLLASTPKDASTATKPVTAITLRFTEPVRQSLTTVRVTGPDGAAHSDGDPRAVDATVTQKVSTLPTGSIKVGWRTVSVDGHTIQGGFTFTNRAAAATPSTAASSSATPGTAASSGATPGTAASSSEVPAPPVTPAAAPFDARPASATTGSADSTGSGWVSGAVAVVAALVLTGAGLWWRRRRALR